jgi:signal peptidase II
MKWRWLFIALLVVALHQLARIVVFPAVAGQGGSIEVLPFFNLVEVWNPGISFGLFSNLAYGQWLLSGMSMIIIAAVLVWLRKADDTFTVIALCLVIGGALGNLIDRLWFGAVADYLDFHAFGYHWPAFNLTDAAIFLGAVLLFLSTKETVKEIEKLG